MCRCSPWPHLHVTVCLSQNAGWCSMKTWFVWGLLFFHPKMEDGWVTSVYFTSHIHTHSETLRFTFHMQNKTTNTLHSPPAASSGCITHLAHWKAAAGIWVPQRVHFPTCKWPPHTLSEAALSGPGEVLRVCVCSHHVCFRRWQHTFWGYEQDEKRKKITSLQKCYVFINISLSRVSPQLSPSMHWVFFHNIQDWKNCPDRHVHQLQ